MRKAFFSVIVFVSFVGCYHAEHHYEDDCLVRNCTAEEINTKNLIKVKGIRVMLEEELKTLPVNSSRAREARRLLRQAKRLEGNALKIKKNLRRLKTKRDELNYLKARLKHLRSLKRQLE